MSENNTIFAVTYRRATEYLIEAIASANPSHSIHAATRSAARAELAAANIIEEKLASDLLVSIASAKRLMGIVTN